MRFVLLSSVAASAMVSAAAFGQVDPAPAPAAPAAAERGGEIVVTGSRTRSDDILGNVQVLDSENLARDLRPTLGETLAKQPGVSTSGSGPNVARPVLRGLSGERLLILTDGIGALDVSASSSDHAVAINPLTADSIEVLHGPAALLHGASAIGGVVNVIDSRIPRRVPDSGVSAQAIGSLGSAAREVLGSGEVNVAIASALVGHVDVSYTRNEDLDTGSYVLSQPLRAQAAASPIASIRALADLHGKLPNSDGRTFEAAGALAYVGDRSNVGFSVARHTNYYGVPVRYSLDPAVEAESTHIDVDQMRYDARVEVDLDGPFSQVKLRGAYSDYHHDEVEDDGAIGSSVFSKGGEARIDLVQRESGGLGGQSGLQLLKVRQRIEGEEQYLPPVSNGALGLFTVQHLRHGPWRLEAGGRFESTRLSAQASAVVGNPDLTRSFSTLSGSVGGSYDVAPDWRVGVNLARSVRSPSAEELFANGPHAGNASFELGDADLSPEKSIGFEATITRKGPGWNVSATAYGSHFSNFLYQAPTGAIEDDLPVYAFRQGTASYTGFELQADASLGDAAGVTWVVEGQADATRVHIRDFGPAPLIPPLRLKGAVSASRGTLTGRVEVEHDFAHDNTAPLELPTPGFTLVNASADWHPLADARI